MAKKRSSMKKTTRKSRGKKMRGHGIKEDIEAFDQKIKNEFTNPKSELRKQFYREAPFRQSIPIAMGALSTVPGPIGTTAQILGAADQIAHIYGVGRKQKYIKYRKTKSHGKRKTK